MPLLPAQVYVCYSTIKYIFEDKLQYHDMLIDCPNTFAGKACQKFVLNSVTYPKGTCTYDSSQSIYPWCSIDPYNENGPFSGSPASAATNPGTSWDYCSCSTSKKGMETALYLSKLYNVYSSHIINIFNKSYILS